MYYGVDPHHPELSSLIQTIISATIEKHGKLYVYALIDGTFDDNVGHQLWEYSKQADTGVVSLYDNTVLSGYEECAPFLVNLSSENLPTLLKLSEGKPMLSIVQSPLPIKALQQHFAAFLQIRTTSDGMRMVLRFADTMCSQNVLNMFNDTQRSAFCSGFTAWHLINRKGMLTTIDGTCLDMTAYMPPAVGEGNAIDVTDRQYAALIDAGEADYILCDLAKQAHFLVAERTSSTLYSMISGLLKQLTEYGIKKDKERYALVAQAIMLPERDQALALLEDAQKHGAEIALQRAASSR
ncbi:DUF4123 domain-containing protein [Collimonas silvisoli]|uniref:DUF4123 domain-containing protein n=1 Tax=Collimonas silvisoli TaxID=2825884 RepID=UPI001B8AF102|nr:DUF4123 domain-containing protein [Collimonas silvisoli]